MTAKDIALPATAGGIAVCFSHPLELTKTRLQLDNERASRGTQRTYAGWTDCVRQNLQRDGVRGLQRGLSLGIAREVAFNGVRLGLHETVLESVHGLVGKAEAPAPHERMLAGFACGALGGCCVNPIEVLKIRMQTQGAATGHQHEFTGVASGLASLVRDEGLAGCMKGIGVSTLRGLMGPGSQLIAYNEMKREAVAHGASAAAVSTHVGCALGSAVVSISAVNPVDVVRTRVYNAPPGRYANAVDAARQLVATEGPLAFYKGALTHYLRLGPHMVLVFGILEQLKARFPN